MSDSSIASDSGNNNGQGGGSSTTNNNNDNNNNTKGSYSNGKRTWDESYQALVKFKEKNGHCLVPIHSHKEDPALGGWIHHQRSKKHKLTESQRQRLDDIGFVWQVRQRNKEWKESIDKLKAFRDVHGNCDVPRDYPADQALADFVQDQRTKYQKGQLSGRRQNQLEDIGLVINVQEPDDGRYYHNGNAEAKKDAKKVVVLGDPYDPDTPLEDHDDDGSDVDANADMEDNEEQSDDNDDDDEEEEEEEGDAISVVELDETFQRNYEKLKEFHSKHGHCRVKLFGHSLGSWVSSLRRKYEDDPEYGISVECQLLLDEIDFDYNGPKISTSSTTTTTTATTAAASNWPAPSLAGMNKDNGRNRKSKGNDDGDEEDRESVSAAASSDGETESDDASSKSDHGSESGSSDGSSLASSSESDTSDSEDDDNDNGDAKSKKRKNPSHANKKPRKKPRNGDASTAWNGSRDKRFMEHYNQLLEFKRIHGHTRVPQNSQYKTLGGWVNNLRVMRNRNPQDGVRADRIKLLDDIGFIWDASGGRPSNDMRWNEQYRSLLAFHAEYGHCRVPQTGKHRSLGRWVATQRAQYNKDPESGIRSDRLKRLNDIGFTWNAKGFKGKHFYKERPRDDQPCHQSTGRGSNNAAAAAQMDSSATESDGDDMSTVTSEGENGAALNAGEDPESETCQRGEGWPIYYNKLLEFHSKKGHVSVPNSKKYRNLRVWLDGQRQFYSTCTAIDHDEVRRRRLKDAGCSWAISKEEKDQWYKDYNKLVEFQRDHGHCYVSLVDDKDLHTWTKAQRKNRSSLDSKQIKALEGIGLKWEDQRTKTSTLNDVKWEQTYQELIEYQSKHGNCLVPQKGENKRLGKWVATQRLTYNKDPKKGGIRPDRLKKLNDIGFVWNAHQFRGRRGSLDGEFVGANFAANPTIGQIEPLVTTLINAVQKVDAPETKDALVESCRRGLESMIAETEERLYLVKMKESTKNKEAAEGLRFESLPQKDPELTQKDPLVASIVSEELVDTAAIKQEFSASRKGSAEMGPMEPPVHHPPLGGAREKYSSLATSMLKAGPPALG